MKKLLTLICLLALSQMPCQAQISWGTPTMISTMGVNASDPHIVTDGTGNAAAVWVENNQVKTSYYTVGVGWGSITTLSNVSNTASNPRLGIDSSGDVTAIWLENGVVYTSTLPFGGSWSAETAISNLAGTATTPVIRVDATGNKVAVWQRNGFIEAIQNPQSIGTWGTVSQLSTNGADDHPDAFIGSGGTIVAVWHQLVSGSDLIYSSRGSVNGAWGSPVNAIAATPGAHHNYPRVVVDSTGNAFASWFRYLVSGTTYSGVATISSTLSSTSSTWLALPTQLSEAGMFNPANLFLRMAVDNTGNVLAAWTNSYDGSNFTVEVGVLPQGGSWQTPNSLVVTNPYAFQVDISATSIGLCVANMMYYDGADIQIQSFETSINGIQVNNWTLPTTVTNTADNNVPRVSAQYDSSNQTIYGTTVWANYNGSNNVIMASVGTEAAITPPTSVSATQSSNNFGVFTEYFNTITWTDSTDPRVVQYIVYRNGVAFDRVSPGVHTYIDHNAVQSQSVVYGVAAETVEQILSPIVTYTLP